MKMIKATIEVSQMLYEGMKKVAKIRGGKTKVGDIIQEALIYRMD